MGNGGIEDVGHWSRKGDCTFISDRENFISTSIFLHHGFDFSDDTGVNTTTETFIGSEWDKQPLLRSEVRFLFGEICFIGDDTLN